MSFPQPMRRSSSVDVGEADFGSRPSVSTDTTFSTKRQYDASNEYICRAEIESWMQSVDTKLQMLLDIKFDGNFAGDTSAAFAPRMSFASTKWGFGSQADGVWKKKIKAKRKERSKSRADISCTGSEEKSSGELSTPVNTPFSPTGFGASGSLTEMKIPPKIEFQNSGSCFSSLPSPPRKVSQIEEDSNSVDSLKQLEESSENETTGTSDCPEQEAPPSILFLPESRIITFIDILYQLFIAGEFCVVTGSMAMGRWNKSPNISEITYLVAASSLTLIFMLSRLYIARLEGWTLIDSDAAYIRKKYFQEWLAFDVFTGFPIDLILLPVTMIGFRITQVCRLFKILRSPSLFRTSNPLGDARRLQPLTMLTIAVVVLHVIAVLYITIKDDRTDQSIQAFYIEGVYWAVQTTSSVGFGDLTDDTRLSMRLFSAAIMLVGSGGYAWCVGHVSVYFMAKDHVRLEQQKTRSIVKSLLLQYDVPLSIQKEAFTIYPIVFDIGAQHTSILNTFPPYLQELIGTHMRLRLIMRVPMFQGSEVSIMKQLAAKLTKHMAQPNEVIIEIGNTGKEMYFLATGAVDVSVGTQSLVMLRDGSWFGEIAILRETKRCATVKSVTVCELYCLTKEDFIKVLNKYPKSRFNDVIHREIERRLNEVSDFQGGTASHESDASPPSSFRFMRKVDTKTMAPGLLTEATVNLDSSADKYRTTYVNN